MTAVPDVSVDQMVAEVRATAGQMKVLGTFTIEHVVATKESAFEFLGDHGCVGVVSGIPDMSGPAYVVQIRAEYAASSRREPDGTTKDIPRRRGQTLFVVDGTTGQAVAVCGQRAPADLTPLGDVTMDARAATPIATS